VYIDADCLVTGSIEPLLMLPAPMVGAVGARSQHARRPVGPCSAMHPWCRLTMANLHSCSTDSILCNCLLLHDALCHSTS